MVGAVGITPRLRSAILRIYVAIIYGVSLRDAEVLPAGAFSASATPWLCAFSASSVAVEFPFVPYTLAAYDLFLLIPARDALAVPSASARRTLGSTLHTVVPFALALQVETSLTAFAVVEALTAPARSALAVLRVTTEALVALLRITPFAMLARLAYWSRGVEIQPLVAHSKGRPAAKIGRPPPLILTGQTHNSPVAPHAGLTLHMPRA